MTVPLVSILMGVYNGEKTLSRSIDSVKRQTFFNWEFIIFNDGSTDNTSTILKRYSDEDPRIHILNGRGKNGLASGLNQCLFVAKGKYIARMDDDDISLPERLFKQVDYLEKHNNVDAVGSSMIVFDECGEKGIRHNDVLITKKSFLKGSPFFHPTIMIKRKVLKDLNGYRTDVGRTEDLDLWFRFFQGGYVGCNLQEPLLKYHENITDYSKRTIRNGLLATYITFSGYKNIDISLINRWRAFRPLISSLIPKRLMKKYHEFKLDR